MSGDAMELLTHTRQPTCFEATRSKRVACFIPENPERFETGPELARWHSSTSTRTKSMSISSRVFGLGKETEGLVHRPFTRWPWSILRAFRRNQFNDNKPQLDHAAQAAPLTELRLPP